MRVIPVLDLKDGRAVHARGGQRDRYVPVQSRLVPLRGDALALARAYRQKLGCEECYVADLDAITGGGEPQWPLIRSIARVGARCLVDAACASAPRAREILAAGASRVIVGLESLDGFEVLATICAVIGSERVLFSLDLDRGEPMIRIGAQIVGDPLDLVDRAVRAGVSAVLVLDLARVGAGGGVDLELVRRIRAAYPDLELLAGGGVSSASDLNQSAGAGLDGVLVATALHDGRLGAADYFSDSR